MEVCVVEGIDIFGVLNHFYPGIGSFLGWDVPSDFIFLFFLGKHFSSVALALVSHVNPELIDRLVRSFSSNITSGVGASDWLIKFDPLVNFCALIDSLGNVILPQIGATSFSFDFSSLSLDDACVIIPLKTKPPSRSWPPYAIQRRRRLVAARLQTSWVKRV